MALARKLERAWCRVARDSQARLFLCPALPLPSSSFTADAAAVGAAVAGAPPAVPLSASSMTSHCLATVCMDIRRLKYRSVDAFLKDTHALVRPHPHPQVATVCLFV